MHILLLFIMSVNGSMPLPAGRWWMNKIMTPVGEWVGDHFFLAGVSAPSFLLACPVVWVTGRASSPPKVLTTY